ncbi:hypothetical protein ACE2AJ_15150 [Aquihabitans daechungensis]|uniref:CsbD family protein n=1 Tax=Aquihabitans daechungensis TaxID=1052257 RepID=UPI003B9F59F4
MRTEDPIDLATHGVPSDNDSLVGVLRDLEDRGFAASYRPAPDAVEGRAAVRCGACGRSTPAEDLDVVAERRLEGASDPDDLVLVVAATCPACETGGVIVLGYGPEASVEDSDIVVALRHPDAVAVGGDDDEEDGSTADPGGDSDPDAGEGFEPPRTEGAGGRVAGVPFPQERATMAQDDEPSTIKQAVGKVTEKLGWATADRRMEAEGKLEQLEVPDPDADDAEAEDVLDDADLHVRADHGDLAPQAEPSDEEQPVKANPNTDG